MAKKPKPQKMKKVAYRFLIPEEHEAMYALLDELIQAHHEELRDARIALAWNLAWQPDVDGRVTLGKCVKVGDLHREIAGQFNGFDFVIVLHQKFWTHEMTVERQRRALLDHELCHATVSYDVKGEPVVDERGRNVYRVRRHDLEEFREIADRHGCWKSDIEDFQKALDRARAKADERWVGYTTLREELLHAGADVPVETITGWTEDQRREALTWAVLRADKTKLLFELVPPACVLEVTGAIAQDVSVAAVAATS